jgi:hypothetical protein
MTPAITHFNFLTSNKSKGRVAVLANNCDNKYHTEELAQVPRGTVIKIDFGCDSGVYAVADVGGVLHKVLIPIGNFQYIKLVAL